MKAILRIAITALACAAGLLQVNAQGFTSGSTGSDGPLNITTNTTLDLPTNGVFNYTTITVDQGATLGFRRNLLNTPVHLLASGAVIINGTINVSGSATLGNFTGGAGGPGGFDGGAGGILTTGQALPGGAGQGPGGGRSGVGGHTAANEAGGGSYGTRPEVAVDARDGQTYGSPLLIPLIGGSGGGGTDGNKDIGGGGGGGAILIASSTIIRINSTGAILSRGGAIVTPNRGNGGSGGAIRLVAPRVYGLGTLNVRGSGFGGSLDSGGASGAGRIRIDSIFRFEPTNAAVDNIGFNLVPSIVTSVGSAMVVFPPNNPRLDILQAAGRTIAEGNNGPVFVELPFGADTNQTVTVQARNFATSVAIRVVLTPAAGDPISFDATIDNVTANPAQVIVPVGIPLNNVVAVNAWTR